MNVVIIPKFPHCHISVVFSRHLNHTTTTLFHLYHNHSCTTFLTWTGYMYVPYAGLISAIVSVFSPACYLVVKYSTGHKVLSKHIWTPLFRNVRYLLLEPILDLPGPVSIYRLRISKSVISNFLLSPTDFFFSLTLQV